MMTKKVVLNDFLKQRISASTPEHTTHKKSHCDEWLFL